MTNDVPEIRLEGSGEQLQPFIQQITDHGFNFSFSISDLIEHAGESFTITYHMKLGTTQQTIQNNEAQLVTNVGTFSADSQIRTGGKQFVKVDMFAQSRKLSGAVFILLDQEGRTLIQSDGEYEWQAHGNDSPVQLTSDSQGKFQIIGLKDGNYFLKEIKAPAGYQLNKEKIPFTIDENSFSKKDEAPLKIVNQSRSAGLINKKFKKLMQTGEQHSWLLTIAGLFIVLLILLLMYVRNIKRKREGK